MHPDYWTLIGRFKETPRKLDNRTRMVVCAGCGTIQKLDHKCGICSQRVAPRKASK